MIVTFEELDATEPILIAFIFAPSNAILLIVILLKAAVFKSVSIVLTLIVLEAGLLLPKYICKYLVEVL